MQATQWSAESAPAWTSLAPAWQLWSPWSPTPCCPSWCPSCSAHQSPWSVQQELATQLQQSNVWCQPCQEGKTQSHVLELSLKKLFQMSVSSGQQQQPARHVGSTPQYCEPSGDEMSTELWRKYYFSQHNCENISASRSVTTREKHVCTLCDDRITTTRDLKSHTWQGQSMMKGCAIDTTFSMWYQHWTRFHPPLPVLFIENILRDQGSKKAQFLKGFMTIR